MHYKQVLEKIKYLLYFIVFIVPVYCIKNVFKLFLNKFSTKKSLFSGIFREIVENVIIINIVLKNTDFLIFSTIFNVFTFMLVEKS